MPMVQARPQDFVLVWASRSSSNTLNSIISQRLKLPVFQRLLDNKALNWPVETLCNADSKPLRIHEDMKQRNLAPPKVVIISVDGLEAGAITCREKCAWIKSNWPNAHIICVGAHSVNHMYQTERSNVIDYDLLENDLRDNMMPGFMGRKAEQTPDLILNSVEDLKIGHIVRPFIKDNEELFKFCAEKLGNSNILLDNQDRRGR